MPDAAPASGRHAARLDAVQTACALLLATLASFRAIVGFEPFPWWNSDPFETQVFVTGLTPAAAVWLDAAGLALAAAGIAAHVAAGGRLWRWLLWPALAGSVAAAFWMEWPSTGNTIDCLRLSLAWIAAIWGAVALAHVCAQPRRRALALALLLGVVAMLAAKGVVQVLVEHPETVAWYERDPETFLRAHGWEPGSIQARGYERRLRQPEATGWFGLSNVYATMVGASAVGLAGVAVVGLMERRRAVPNVAATLGALLGVVGLWLCGSKGGAVAAGAGAALTGLVVGIAGRIAQRAGTTGRSEPRPVAPERSTGRSGQRSVARWLVVGTAIVVGAAPLAAVVARGLVGERIGELSLLFRSFYARGALRVVADYPIFGVGPSGFRDAYLQVRPPLAVEDPISPHSVMWDCLTSYGLVGGGAWFVLMLVLVAGAAHGCVRAMADRPRAAPVFEIQTEAARPADDIKLLALLAILATAAAATLERLLTTPETAGLRLLGLLGWVFAAWGVIAIGRTSRRALGVLALGAAATAMLHAGIEVTPTWVGAQGWFFAVLGVAGAGMWEGAQAAPANPDAIRRAKRMDRRLAAVLAVGAVIVLWRAPWGVVGWQARLKEAWTAADDVGRIQDQMRALATDPALAAELGVSWEAVRRELAAMAGASPALSQAEFDAQMTRLIENRSRRAIEILGSAGPARDVPTRRAADRAAQRLAQVHVEAGRLEEAAALLKQRADEGSGIRDVGQTVVLCSHIGGLRRSQAELLDRLGRPDEAHEARRAARSMYEVAAGLDPRGVHHPVRAARVAAVMGDPQIAGEWAERALENHADARLDPLMGLTEAEVAEMEALVEAGRGV